MEQEIHNIIKMMGEDPNREGLKKTPERVKKAYEFLTSGYKKNLKDVIGKGVFSEAEKDMIIINNIEFYSLCEHHILPFFGKIHVGYIPDKKILGLSKIPRIIEMYSRRLQIQERLGRDIANAIIEAIQPKGVGIVIDAVHFCMMMRGVEKQHSKTITSKMLGLFREDPKTREEFLRLIKS